MILLIKAIYIVPLGSPAQPWIEPFHARHSMKEKMSSAKYTKSL